MNNENHDSFCGIYCGACDIMMAGRTGEKYKLASFWNSKSIQRYQKTLGINYDENQPVSYKCEGCKSDKLFVNCASCPIRKCAIDNRVDHCLDCPSYPCALTGNLHRAESFLPHLKTCDENMRRIKDTGTSKWLSEQEDKWRCPECKTPFSWYTGTCKNCGKDLKAYSYKFTYIKSLVLKLGIYAASREAMRNRRRGESDNDRSV